MDYIELPPVEDHDLSSMCPLGWIWHGELHLFPWVTLDEVNSTGWEWTGPIVEHDND
jgi:hypothetical protein